MNLTQSIALALFLMPGTSYALAPDAPGTGGAASPLTVTDSTQIPGMVLKKGAYTIRILDHLSDRMIVRVDRNGKMLSTFLAVPSTSLSKSGPQGPITLSAGVNAKVAIRAFAFEDGTVAEFVYPKNEAVGLAKANDTTIPAIDPVSQGLKGNPALSATDREMVALWMLSPTPVGPDAAGPGIKAERYQAGTASAGTMTPGQVGASGTPTTRVANGGTVAPRPRTRPAMDALPHTAGTLPLVLLSGLLSVAGAAALRRRRLSIVSE